MESHQYGHQWTKKSLAVFTGDHINIRVFYKKMYGRFSGGAEKKGGRNNKVAVRRGFTVA